MKRRAALTPRQVESLRPLLEALMAQSVSSVRIGFDPVEFPRRYPDARDAEVAGLLAASLSYGRADLFRPKIEGLLARLGERPSRALLQLDVEGAAQVTEGFVYRFNVATDVAVLLLGMGSALREHGSLEALFSQARSGTSTLREALGAFTAALRQPTPELLGRLGPPRGLDHLLPSGETGAAKRLCMYLRWMVRGPDEVDLGLWKSIPASALVIPLDTHIARIARLLGLTRRKSDDWKTAEEITASLRQLAPDDPVKFDFALCHLGMSGACPSTPVLAQCGRCVLQRGCRVGRRVIHPRHAAR